MFSILEKEVYFVVISARNLGSKYATVRWEIDSKEEILEMQPLDIKEKTLLIYSVRQPEPIVFTVVDSATNELLKVNGAGSFSVSPSLEKKKAILLFGEGLIHNFITFKWL